MDDIPLDIYEDDACRGCERAEDLAQEAQQWFGDVSVTLHRLQASGSLPRGIVAVPAYVLEGRVIQYGTPEREQIGRALIEALATRGGRPAS